MPRVSPKIRTLGALKESGYKPRSVKQELRDNLRERLAGGGPLFPGILGYDRTVIPTVVNALLAGHDFILLGLRGQAKTRILRSLVTLLDAEIPMLAGSELNDDPLAPISVPGQRLVASAGDDAPVEWLAREERYNEKLATPDVSIADLLGDIDPIKAATRKLTFDILLVFSANPEDYTNRGSIITPLKDRISSQIHTHYPADATIAADITRQEAWTERGVPNVVIPEAFRLLVEEISFAARESDLVDQSSGVSARVAISALELLASNLERRALASGDARVYPRLCDLQMLLPAITGKVEMVYEGEQQGAEVVARRLIGQAVRKDFDRRFPEVGKELGSGGDDDKGPYAPIVRWFAEGNAVTLSDEQPFAEYEAEMRKVPGLPEIAARFGRTREERALAGETVLEGLHQHLKLARADLDSQVSYKEMVKFQLLKPRGGSSGGSSSSRRGGRDRGDIN